MRFIALLTVSFAYSILFQGCRMQPNDYVEEDRSVRIVYTDWSEAVALTHLSKILLEEKMEYDVETKLTDVESAYREIAEGKSDVFTDAWLPETHNRYFEEYKNSIEQLGIIYPDARTGLVVPDYSRYNSITDLQEASMNIVGIDSGAGVMQQTRNALEVYELRGLKLQHLSEAEMTNAFTEAYKRRNEVIITGWEPHWLFARYEARFLEDPEGVFGHKENIFALGTKGIKNKHPHVVQFFERLQLSEKQINNLIYYMNSELDPEDGVREWIERNEYIVNQWVKNLKPERKKIM